MISMTLVSDPMIATLSQLDSQHDWKRSLLAYDLAVFRAGEKLLGEALSESKRPAAIAFLAHGCNTYAKKVAVSIASLGGMGGAW